MSACQSSNHTNQPSNNHSKSNTNANMPSTITPIHNSDNPSILDNSSSPEIINNHSSQVFSGSSSVVLRSSIQFVPSTGNLLVLCSFSSVDQGNSIGYPPIIYTPHSTPSSISRPQSGLSNHVLALARLVTPLGRGSSKTVLVVRSSCGSGSNLRETSKGSEKNKEEEAKEVSTEL